MKFYRFRVHGKAFLKAVVGYLGALLPPGIFSSPRVYVNLLASGTPGGPHRFLRNLQSVLGQKQIAVSKLTPKGCGTALVFSASWGKSFSRLCRLLNVRTVLRVNGFYFPELYGPGKKYPLREKHAWVNQRMKEDLALFDFVIYQSAFSKLQADTHLYQRTDRYTIIYNGVDSGYFTPAGKENGSGPLTLLTLGKQSHDYLTLSLEVFKRVSRLIPHARLKIVGPAEGLIEDVLRYVSSYFEGDPSANRVEYLGIIPFEQLPAVLRQADLLLHPRIGDACPNAVLEAMACGLPVVCPSWGGTKELIGSGGIAVDSPPGEGTGQLVKGMADAVVKIQGALSAYSRAARSEVENRFAIESIIRQYLEVLFPDLDLR